MFLWLLYPIAYGLDDGGNKITVRNGTIFFGILDLLTVPVMAAIFMISSRSWDYGVLNLHFTQYGRVTQGGAFPGKDRSVPVRTAGVSNGEGAANGSEAV